MNITLLLPRVSKHYLYLTAAFVWTFAGGMLLFRGFSSIGSPDNLAFKLFFCTLAGLLFYAVVFARLSKKHVLRIQNMESKNPVVFSFFNLKSYLMMFSMITLGITLRLSGLVTPEHLALMHVTMGIPLFLSSFRFYHSFTATYLPSKSVSVPIPK